MFGDEIILRGEAAYQNVKGTFPGNRGYLVGSSLAGKPYPPHGIAVVWTGKSWKPEGITPLDSVDDLQTYAGAEGAIASVLGVQYTYGAGGWVEVGGGGVVARGYVGCLGANLWTPDVYDIGVIQNNGYLDNSGAFQTNSSYYLSGHIPVDSLATYILAVSPGMTQYGGMYDASGNWVAPLFSGANNTPIPSGISSVRINVLKTDLTNYGQSSFRKILPYAPIIPYIPKSITAIGDSITAGSYVYRSYWKLAGDVLGIEESQMSNAGMNGSTVAAGSDPMYNRISTAKTSDYMVLLGGVNDFTSNVPLGTVSSSNTAEFYGALNSIALQLLKKAPDSKIVLCTPTRKAGWNTANASGSNLEDYANAIIAIGRKFGISVADFFHDIPDYTTTPIKTRYLADGTHPTYLGNYPMADVLLRALRQ